VAILLLVAMFLFWWLFHKREIQSKPGDIIASPEKPKTKPPETAKTGNQGKPGDITSPPEKPKTKPPATAKTSDSEFLRVSIIRFENEKLFHDIRDRIQETAHNNKYKVTTTSDLSGYNKILGTYEVHLKLWPLLPGDIFLTKTLPNSLSEYELRFEHRSEHELVITPKSKPKPKPYEIKSKGKNSITILFRAQITKDLQDTLRNQIYPQAQKILMEHLKGKNYSSSEIWDIVKEGEPVPGKTIREGNRLESEMKYSWQEQ
jgi:hypothetical protein